MKYQKNYYPDLGDGLVFRPIRFKRDEAFLVRAMMLATKSRVRFRHGAIIVRNGKVIGVGINRTINPPTVVSDPKQESTVHAEEAALRACRKMDLSNATIYIARIGAFGEPMLSKPCERCQRALRARGVKKIYYTT